MSPIKYRNMLRLNKALEILKSGEYSVIETAMIVGFDDPAYFSRIFKDQFGNSPSYFIPSERNTT
jgi:transcriptional regulator GlxA family with amidase domain